MEITLTPELEDLLNEELQTGDYFSPTDVLREGLLSLRTRRIPKEVRLENLRREVQKGIDDIQQGNYKTYDSADEMMEEIIKEARTEFEAKKTNGK
jgi:antitoxin ParD1/3/4